MRQNLKIYIGLFLFVLLSLSTGLTFVLTSFFWFQEAARLYIQEKESEIRLLGQQYINAPEQTEDSPSVAMLLTFVLQKTEASDACALLENGHISCANQITPSQTGAMQGVLKEAALEQSVAHTVSGVVWQGPLPLRKHLDLAVPMLSPKLDTTVVLRYPLTPLYEEIAPLLRYAGIYLMVNLLILLVLGFFRMYRDVLRPIERLIRRADAWTEQEGIFLPNLQGYGEFGQLGHSIQGMLHRIRTDQEKLKDNLASLAEANRLLLANQKEMVRAEKLSSIGQLAAGLAHEIGNPLGIVQGYLGLLREDGLPAEQRADYLNRAEQELERISQLIRQLLDYSRPTRSDDCVVDAHEVLQAALDLLQPQPLLREISLRARFVDQDVPVYGNPAQLTQVFLNCLINAVDAIHARTTSGRGSIELSSSLQEDLGRSVLRIEIADTGTGLTEPVLANALDPFFTTKKQGLGTGLGLSVSSALLRDMGGDIVLTNRDEGGARVIILLPLYNMDKNADSGSPLSDGHGKKRKKTVDCR